MNHQSGRKNQSMTTLNDSRIFANKENQNSNDRERPS